MSLLKYRLRELLPRLSEQGKGVKDKEVRRRLYLIRAIVSSKRTLKAACDFRGVGRDKFYEWANRLLEHGNVLDLRPQSRRPKRSPNKTKEKIEKKIVRIKNKKPYLGPERISVALEDEFSIHIPPSTIYAVLVRNKLISKEYRSQRTKKHTKKYRRPIPGYLQMDFKYVPYLVLDKQFYQLSVVDHCTSWRMIRVYRRKGEAEVKSFLDELNLICPFPIFEIQTDNDVAFTDKYSVAMGGRPTGAHSFDEWCKYYGCRHKLIPPGEKELNGKVENTHKYDDEEFYSQNYFTCFQQLEISARKHEETWNERRKTKTLGWRTPSETVAEIKSTILALLLFCRRQDPKVLEIPKAQMKEKTQLPSKLKKRRARYLKYLDWEAAQYYK